MMASLVGQDIAGRYRILEVLGQGGMAVVYKAYDTRLDRPVAIKFIRSRSLNKQHAVKMLRRFEREAKSLAKFSHPNIVKVYDYGEYQGDPFLVMEYLPGGTLKNRTGQRMPYVQAVAILLPIAHALAYAHQREIIHRDVKPANILFSEADDSILTDFGIAKILEAEDGTALTGSGVGIGTPEYMSPEQATGQSVDFRSDVYALGIVLYELVTGRRPFTGDTPVAVLLQHVQDAVPPARQFAPDLPDEFLRILDKALEKNPYNRYADMNAFAEDLQTLVGEARQPLLPPQMQATEAETATMPQPGATKSPSSPSLPTVARIRTDSHPAIPFGTAARPGSGRNWLIPALIIFGVIVIGAVGILLVTGLLLFSPSSSKGRNLPADSTALPTPSTGMLYPAAGATQIIPKDDSIMVYVPEGEFTMGDPPTSPESHVDQYHQHPVYLSAYWIDRTEVTNAAFEKFVSESGYQTGAEKAGSSLLYSPQTGQWESTKGVDWKHPQGADSSIKGLEKHPVIHVDWNDARAYCAWAGKRLPSEAEWEKAARNTDGRKYPWGDQTPTGNLANIADQNVALEWASSTINDGQRFTASTGSYPQGASPFGALDMAGNVWEWVEDAYDKDFYFNAPYANPVNDTPGTTRILRGGSWASRLPLAALRVWEIPNYRDDNNGFRCALTAAVVLPDEISRVQTTSTAIAVYNLAKTYQGAAQVQIEATQKAISTCMKDVKTFGSALYSTRTCDDFSINFNNWYASAASGAWGTYSCEFKDDQLLWEVKSKQARILDNPLSSYVVDDFEAGLAAKQTAGSPNAACFGIVFRKYLDQFYFFKICGNKHYAVSLRQNGKWKSLVEENTSPAILPGETNRLNVSAKGSKFDFYVNGQKLASVTDSAIPVGTVGIGVHVAENQNVTFAFDKFFLRSP